MLQKAIRCGVSLPSPSATVTTSRMPLSLETACVGTSLLVVPGDLASSTVTPAFSHLPFPPCRASGSWTLGGAASLSTCLTVVERERDWTWSPGISFAVPASISASRRDASSSHSCSISCSLRLSRLRRRSQASSACSSGGRPRAIDFSSVMVMMHLALVSYRAPQLYAGGPSGARPCDRSCSRRPAA